MYSLVIFMFWLLLSFDFCSDPFLFYFVSLFSFWLVSLPLYLFVSLLFWFVFSFWSVSLQLYLFVSLLFWFVFFIQLSFSSTLSVRFSSILIRFFSILIGFSHNLIRLSSFLIVSLPLWFVSLLCIPIRFHSIWFL